MRLVVDTNVLVSAAIKPNGRFPTHLRQGAFRLLVSDALLYELVDVLNRSRLRTKYHLTPEYIHVFLRLLRQHSEYIDPTERISACRDKDDNKFLEIAVAAQAEAVVTNDSDLLVLHPFRSIPILSIIDFWDYFTARQLPEDKREGQ